MTTTETDAARVSLRWIRAQAEPGRRWLRRAAALEIAAAGGSILQWAALAGIAQTVISAPHPALRGIAPMLGLLLAGGLGAALARHRAALASQRGADRISDVLRERILGRLLPDRLGTESVPPSLGATVFIENVSDVGDYLRSTEPLRRSAPVAMMLVFAAVAVVHWPVAVILAACTALMPLNMRLAGLSARDASRARLRQMDRLSAVVLESFHGMATLRTLGAIVRRRASIQDASTRLNQATAQVLRRAFLSSLIMDAVVTFAIATCATYVGLSLLGYVHLTVAPPLNLFSGLFVLLLCPMYFVPLRRLATSFHQQDRALAAAETIMPLDVDADAIMVAPASLADGMRRGSSSVPGVRAAGLSYRHAGASEPTLAGVDLTAQPGRWTAVSGRSGAGKTTLLTILAGLRPPSDGTVRWVDDTGEHPPGLTRAGWIGQHTVIVDGTLAENIRLADPAATQADLDRVAAIAGLEELINRLPAGLDTRVGDGGAGVSAGEARRLAIARTVLTGARLWFLDEPTAHLDHATEEKLLDALRLATVGCTVVVATHSPAVLRFADDRVHLEQGVIEWATPAL